MIFKLYETSNRNKVTMIQVSTDLDNKLIIVYLISRHFSPEKLLRNRWGNVCWRIADLWSFRGEKWSLDGSGICPWSRRSLSSSICAGDSRCLLKNQSFKLRLTLVKTDFNQKIKQKIILQISIELMLFLIHEYVTKLKQNTI